MKDGQALDRLDDTEIEGIAMRVLVGQEHSEHIGKTIKSIETSSGDSHLLVQERIVFHFTDNTSLELGIDWRGENSYISQYRDSKPHVSRETTSIIQAAIDDAGFNSKA